MLIVSACCWGTALDGNGTGDEDSRFLDDKSSDNSVHGDAHAAAGVYC